MWIKSPVPRMLVAPARLLALAGDLAVRLVRALGSPLLFSNPAGFSGLGEVLGWMR